MGLKSDLTAEVKSTFSKSWTVETATGVPDPDDLLLNSNHAKDLETATVLYADLDGSTSMVDQRDWQFSAEVYKTYLRCASEVIRSEGGVITAYDGDRVMAVFTGGSKNTSAARSALKINYAVLHIIQPALDSQYPQSNFKVRQIVGVDTSRLRTARIGVRGDNDLVWIGRAANYAAKLTTLSGVASWITEAVYDNLHQSLKTAADGRSMWERKNWGNLTVYSSTWYWSID